MKNLLKKGNKIKEILKFSNEGFNIKLIDFNSKEDLEDVDYDSLESISKIFKKNKEDFKDLGVFDFDIKLYYSISDVYAELYFKAEKSYYNIDTLSIYRFKNKHELNFLLKTMENLNHVKHYNRDIHINNIVQILKKDLLEEEKVIISQYSFLFPSDLEFLLKLKNQYDFSNEGITEKSLNLLRNAEKDGISLENIIFNSLEEKIIEDNIKIFKIAKLQKSI